MIIPAIDISAFFDTSILTVNEMDLLTETVVSSVTSEIYNTILELAKTRLKSTRENYLRNLNVQINGKNGLISMTDRFALMIEDGASPFDMKDGFQKAALKRGQTRADGTGWYLTIPFRIGTPAVVGDEFQPMPNEIYNVAKKLRPYLSSNMIGKSNVITRSNEHLTIEQLQTIDNKFRTDHSDRQVRPFIADIEPAKGAPYRHESPLYAGMVKIQKGTYEHATQNTYMTFRRVSDKSVEKNPNSWIHKGIKAYKFFETAAAQTDIDSITKFAMVQVFKELNV